MRTYRYSVMLWAHHTSHEASSKSSTVKQRQSEMDHRKTGDHDLQNPPPKRAKLTDGALQSSSSGPAKALLLAQEDLEKSSTANASVSVNEEDLSSGSSSAASLPLPLELQNIDFAQRITWNKYAPYIPDQPIPRHALDAPPTFTERSPALCHHVNAVSGRARACTLHLKPSSRYQQPAARPLPTPMFMPVGTKGCLKGGVTFQELTTDPALQCPILLANTYHLAIQPGTELVAEMGGLHAFQGMSVANQNTLGVQQQPTTAPQEADNGTTSSPTNMLPYNLLTDSGGFQMVSLVKLSQVTEEGVSFENPYKRQGDKKFVKAIVRNNIVNNNVTDEKADAASSAPTTTSDPDRSSSHMLLLRPEDSIRHQNNIGANIIMALDDVISSVTADEARFREATHRTLRWYDRCYNAHCPPHRDCQNLFPIVQGGLDTALGGLREQCLAGFRHRDQELHYVIPGYAIGGLAGGEEKDAFWRVVDQCCRALPDDKPRYLMGVGYPLDLVVCTALGVDMYDCVYPTRTARFGVALVDGPAPGTLRIRANECGLASSIVIQDGCLCPACREGFSRARLHTLFKSGNPVAVELLTQHNIAYMMTLVQKMRQAILDDRYADFARHFVQRQYPGKAAGGDEPPEWVVEALGAAGIDL